MLNLISGIAKRSPSFSERRNATHQQSTPLPYVFDTVSPRSLPFVVKSRDFQAQGINVCYREEE